jgi:hypothetical protein
MSLTEVIAEQRAKFFPMALPNGATAYCCTPQEFMEAVSSIYGDVFGRPPEHYGFFQTPEARKPTADTMYAHYCTNLHHEFIVAKDSDGKYIGWCIGEAEDFATFYLRNAGVVTGSRHQGFLRAFLPKFLLYLRAIGYERVTSEHHPNNLPIMIGMLKNGFVISGFNLDERYGAQVKMVRMLQEDRRQSFESIFHLPPPHEPLADGSSERTSKKE